MIGKYYGLLIVFALLLGLQASNAQRAVAPASKTIDARRLLLDLETLSADAMEGRGVGTPGGAKAREYIAERFKASGLTAFGGSFVQPFEFANRRGEKIAAANVVGYVKGRKTPDRYLVVTAHYDHLGTRDGVVYNGADDNASGTAALFALAAHFSRNRPAHSIIFAALDSEEAGLEGAKKFVAAPPVKKAAIALNVNMDMIAHNDKSELYAVGPGRYPFLKSYLEAAAARAPVKLLFGHEPPAATGQDDWTSQSDHFAFHEAGVPFVYFGVEDHKDYHQSTDDFGNINQTFYVGAVETILDAVKRFDAGLAEIEKRKPPAVK
jgi:Zn-dependent M28 family amino/carboxypeptidase